MLLERKVRAASPTRNEFTPAGERFVAVLRDLQREVDLVECDSGAGREPITVDRERSAAMAAE